MSSFLYYPQEPPLDSDVSPSMTSLHSSKRYWFTHIHLKTGGRIVLKWRRPWDGRHGHNRRRAVHVNWKKREVEFNNGRFVIYETSDGAE